MQIFGRTFFEPIQNASKNKPEEADVRRNIQKPQQQVYRIRQDIQKWRNAITTAENIYNPQRYNLYQVYGDVVLDAHLTACMQQRKNLTLSRNFKVIDKAGNVNEEKTLLIQKKWFREFLDFSLDSLFWGHSLIQFDSLINDEFKDVDLVPRIYVKPERHIVTSTWSAMDGVDYLDSPYKEWCIGVGGKKDLGLLLKASPLVIWKKNAIGAWSVFQDAFGNPIVMGKTDSRDEATRLNMENAIKTLSTGLSIVADKDDVIEFIEPKKQDAHQVFNELINLCNAEISKLILGQTSTTDQKAFVGSAEVHERVLEGYMEMDNHFIEGVLNYQLMPMLNNLGFGLDGFKIVASRDEDLGVMDKLKVDVELMKYYKLPSDYILETYGTPVEEKPIDTTLNNFQNRLSQYYK